MANPRDMEHMIRTAFGLEDRPQLLAGFGGTTRAGLGRFTGLTLADKATVATALLDLLKQPAPAAAPAATAIDLADLRALKVSPGDIVSSDVHNAVIDALIALAERLGVKPLAPVTSVTLAPAFLQHKTGPAWVLDAGAANTARDGADGIMPVLLPDGLRIESLAVFGSRPAQVQAEAFDVKLHCRELKSGRVTELIARNLNGGDDPFEKEAFVLSGAEGLARVRAADFHYFVTATVTNLDLGRSRTTPAITGVRIRCVP